MELNEGLETLGTDDRPDGNEWAGVFEDSALESVKLPGTLKDVEQRTFMCCGRLRRVQLPNRLEHIGAACFCNSGLEEIVLPSSVKVVGMCAFQECE